MRLQILRGDPTPEEIAALTVALARAEEQDARRRLAPAPPAWLVAARLESVGRGMAAAPADLELRR